ncbi:hypothetical protein HMI55_004871 [Coelomomyces lativittatus]|nr:hypothetical protein HMI55_004871 [Coelomomyces lativittatus]
MHLSIYFLFSFFFFFFLVRDNHTKIVELLISRGASVLRKDVHQWSALDYAKSSRLLSSVLEDGAKKERVELLEKDRLLDVLFRSSLPAAEVIEKVSSLLNSLLESDPNFLHRVNHQGYGLIHRVVDSPSINVSELITFLYHQGCRLDLPMKDGFHQTALHSVCTHPSPYALDAAKTLLMHVPQLSSISDQQGFTPLQWARHQGKGSKEMLQLLSKATALPPPSVTASPFSTHTAPPPFYLSLTTYASDPPFLHHPRSTPTSPTSFPHHHLHCNLPHGPSIYFNFVFFVVVVFYHHVASYGRPNPGFYVERFTGSDFKIPYYVLDG